MPRQRQIRRQTPLGKTRDGSKWLDWALEETALAATRTKDVYLAAQYQRLRPRRGHKKALGAIKHSITCACWHMLSTGELYTDLGGDYGALPGRVDGSGRDVFVVLLVRRPKSDGLRTACGS